MIKGSAQSSTPDIRAKPGLWLIGNLGNEVSTRNMRSAVIWHGREGMAFVFRMPILMWCVAPRQHTLQVDTINTMGDRLQPKSSDRTM